MQTSAAPTPSNGSVQKNLFYKKDKTVYSVLVTKNYDQFKIMGDNRNLNLLHVKRLMRSFNERHLVSPIIVNEKFYVIDGQHRLEASKETKSPIYYIVVPGYNIKEVQILNTNQKNWLKIDYLHSYCAEGRKVYLEFKGFMELFPEFKFQAVERILTGLQQGGKQGSIDGKRAQSRSFEEGKLIIPDINYSTTVARKIMDFKPYYEGFGRGIFATAMMPLFKSKNYNHKEMLHKLESSPMKLRDCLNVDAYRMLLEDIYNYKRQKEHKVSFRHE